MRSCTTTGDIQNGSAIRSRDVSLPSANPPSESAPAWPMPVEELGMFIGWDRSRNARRSAD
jgi:hypothetical protein